LPWGTIAFFDEAAARLKLAYCVITGRVPIEVDRRWHNRNAECPVLIEVSDWTSERRVFSALVWPSLDTAPETAAQDHFERVAQVKQVIARGAAEMALTTRFDTDWDLAWHPQRKVWVAQDGFAYDGWRPTDDRQPSGQTPGRGHPKAQPSSAEAALTHPTDLQRSKHA
jgi:hypothetical protein